MLALFSLVSTLLAVPVVRALSFSSTSTNCSLANVTMTMLDGQTALVKPTTAPSFVTLAVGVQNYTCANTSTYITTGTTGIIAELFDLSCMVHRPEFANLTNVAFDVWSVALPDVTTQQMIDALAKKSFGHISDAVIGQHYIIPNPAGSGVSPKWDLTSTQGNANAFVVGVRDVTVDAPVPSADIPWVKLHNVQGSLATSIYRVYTKGGQPPASCTPGTPAISIKFTGQYWFFGSTF